MLTEASISGRVDFLRDLKENVTMGRPPPTEEELELEREMEYFIDPPSLVRRQRVSYGEASP